MASKNKKSMFMVLKRHWEVFDGSRTKVGKRTADIIIPPGRHEIERIPNPYGHANSWLVLKGTLFGMKESSWRQFRNGSYIISNRKSPDFGKPNDWGDLEVIIEENF